MLFAMRLSLIKPYALSNKTTACAYPFTMRLFAMHTLPESARGGKQAIVSERRWNTLHLTVFIIL